MKAALVRHRDESPVTEINSGRVQRIVTGGDGGVANVHWMKISTGSPHFHGGYDEVYYVLAGEGTITLAEKSCPLRPGTVVTVPFGVLHSLQAGPGQEVEFVIFGTPAMSIDDSRALPMKPLAKDCRVPAGSPEWVTKERIAEAIQLFESRYGKPVDENEALELLITVGRYVDVMSEPRPDRTVRRCRDEDFEAILAIINGAATAYRGVIPDDRWHEPYMSSDELQHEIASGVEFWCFEQKGEMLGVMGIQDVRDVTLIRHAYVRTDKQKHGIGKGLLAGLRAIAERPVLIGTWAAATWAIGFYESQGFRLVWPDEKDRLLKKYWSVPERQIETSVVLADSEWFRKRRPVVRYREQVQTIDCPFGHVQRIVTAGEGGIANVHLVKITKGTRHIHQGYDEVYYVLAGEGTITLGDTSYPLRPGSVAVIPAGIAHSLGAIPGCNLEFIIHGTPPMSIEHELAKPRKA